MKSEALVVILFIIGFVFIIFGVIILSSIPEGTFDKASLIYGISTVADGAGIGCIVVGLLFMLPLLLSLIGTREKA